MTEDKLARVHDPDDEIFTAEERTVLRFASAMSQNETAETVFLFAEMRQFFDEAAIVEIGMAVATLHGMNIFNNMFGIEREDHQMVSQTGLSGQAAAE